LGQQDPSPSDATDPAVDDPTATGSVRGAHRSGLAGHRSRRRQRDRDSAVRHRGGPQRRRHQFQPTLQGATISLTQGQIQIGQDGQGAVANLTIDGQGLNITINPNGNSRAFEIINGGSETINNLNFVGGQVTGDFGGAISVDAGTVLSLSNDTFTANLARQDAGGNFGSGGAVANAGTLVVSGCTFSGNLADANGGAISSDSAGSGSLTILAGVDAQGNPINSTFSGNVAQGNGGAVCTADVTSISNATFTGNNAVSKGGALFTSGSTTINNGFFGGAGDNQGNTAGQGGAVDARGSVPGLTSLTVTNSAFTNNRATGLAVGGGGGIFSDDVTRVTSSTFTGNYAAAAGGCRAGGRGGRPAPPSPRSGPPRVPTVAARPEPAGPGRRRRSVSC
jgi:predicted outer membrane repeat protein